MEINCAFATQMGTPEHIRAAEQLRYTRAWCYDSPSIYSDVWRATAVLYQPAGPDIPRELETFMEAAQLVGTAPATAPATA